MIFLEWVKWQLQGTLKHQVHRMVIHKEGICQEGTQGRNVSYNSHGFT